MSVPRNNVLLMFLFLAKEEKSIWSNVTKHSILPSYFNVIKYVHFPIFTSLKLQVLFLILIGTENNPNDLKSFDTYSACLFPAPFVYWWTKLVLISPVPVKDKSLSSSISTITACGLYGEDSFPSMGKNFKCVGLYPASCPVASG